MYKVMIQFSQNNHRDHNFCFLTGSPKFARLQKKSADNKDFVCDLCTLLIGKIEEFLVDDWTEQQVSFKFSQLVF